MKNVMTTSFLFLFMLIAITCNSQEKDNVSAKIEVNNIEGALKLKAIAKNEGTVHQSLNYIFLALKKSKQQNMSSTQQENKFTLSPGEIKILGEINLNIVKEDALKVYLFIKDEKSQKVIAKDSLEMNSKNFNNSVAYEKTSSEENMMLKSLVINDTKTKIGDDFYGKFFSLLMLNDISFTFRVRIAELPTNGRNTQVQVFANEENIASFNAKPDDDFLNDMVQQTVALLINYEKQQQVNDRGFIY